ncbi:MAG: hypothetical protein RSE13_04125 [Planktothrix sp. GU0601_MAG3]|nr:MAG: hypothetical protein RSE13_04125 [Planktothrix sp. GU0601_MAG3]
MIISDLSYLESANNSAVVGGIADLNYTTDLKFEECVDIWKEFEVTATVDGISAFAEADAYAEGENAHAEALSFTFSEVDGCGYGTVSASATSLSISG